MEITKYGFIFCLKGFQLNSENQVTMKSPDSEALIVGIANKDDVFAAAKQMQSQNVQVIELCGAFDKSWAKKLDDHLGNTIPIGFVENA